MRGRSDLRNRKVCWLCTLDGKTRFKTAIDEQFCPLFLLLLGDCTVHGVQLKRLSEHVQSNAFTECVLEIMRTYFHTAPTFLWQRGWDWGAQLTQCKPSSLSGMGAAVMSFCVKCEISLPWMKQISIILPLYISEKWEWAYFIRERDWSRLSISPFSASSFVFFFFLSFFLSFSFFHIADMHTPLPNISHYLVKSKVAPLMYILIVYSYILDMIEFINRWKRPARG